jgi:hypothetical protein
VENGLIFNTYTNGEACVTWLASPDTVVDLRSVFNRTNQLTFDNNPAPGRGFLFIGIPDPGNPGQEYHLPGVS